MKRLHGDLLNVFEVCIYLAANLRQIKFKNTLKNSVFLGQLLL